MESLLKKMDTCTNDPDKSSTTQLNKHIMCGYSLVTHCSFDKKNNANDYYRGKDCLKKFCQDLKKQAKSIFDFEKKEMIKLIQEEQYKHDSRKYCFLCKKTFFEDAKNNYIKKRDHCHYTGKYRGSAHKICNLMYNTPREILVIFHNSSSYDCHFIIKGLAEEFEGDFECLGENKEKSITFSVPVKKESNEDGIIIYRTKFIDSFRFMPTSLSSLVDNLSEGIHDNGKCTKCNSSLEYISISKTSRLLFECFDCKKRYRRKFDKNLTKKFKNIYNFCNEDIDKFMLSLRKGIYPCLMKNNYQMKMIFIVV